MTSRTEDDISDIEFENSINISKTTRFIKQKQVVSLNMGPLRDSLRSLFKDKKEYTAYKSFFSGVPLHILKAYSRLSFCYKFALSYLLRSIFKSSLKCQV